VSAPLGVNLSGSLEDNLIGIAIAKTITRVLNRFEMSSNVGRLLLTVRVNLTWGLREIPKQKNISNGEYKKNAVKRLL